VTARALDHAGVTVVRVPPAVDVLPLVETALARGQALVLAPGRPEAAELAGRLRRDGLPVARPPEGWGAAAGGIAVVGSRAGVWFPAPDLRAVVVLDEHDPRYQEERAPTWHARDVAVERARRAGVPCLLVSPTPSPESLALGPQLAPSRDEERRGWPTVEVIDRTVDPDPHRHGLYSPRLVAVMRGDARVVVLVNRVGRARLLACRQCSQLATCESCGGALASADVGSEPGRLTCPRCGSSRPAGCEHCGASRLRALRVGVSRVREELEALLREPVGELTAAAAGEDGPAAALPDERVVVGTEAALHRIRTPDVIAFPDLDAQLAAPRFGAAAEVLHQLALAARRLGGRRPGARLVVQTRLPYHPVVTSALHADPTRAIRALADQARRLRLPPFAALAQLSGAGAPDLAGRLERLGLEISGPVDGRYLVRAGDWTELANGLAAAGRGDAPVRVEVSPARI
jgi:primosomal protein N' (replication factor Y)